MANYWNLSLRAIRTVMKTPTSPEMRYYTIL